MERRRNENDDEQRDQSRGRSCVTPVCGQLIGTGVGVSNRLGRRSIVSRSLARGTLVPSRKPAAIAPLATEGPVISSLPVLCACYRRHRRSLLIPFARPLHHHARYNFSSCSLRSASRYYVGYTISIPFPCKTQTSSASYSGNSKGTRGSDGVIRPLEPTFRIEICSKDAIRRVRRDKCPNIPSVVYHFISGFSAVRQSVERKSDR